MSRFSWLVWFVSVAAMGLAGAVHAQLSLELYIDSGDGLDDPIYVTGSRTPGDDRLFVVTRDGRIEVWLGDQFAPAPYLDLSQGARTPPESVDTESEGGLLGLTFSPDFANDGFFYVYYTAGDPNVSNDLESRLSRFQASGNPLTSNVANPAETILPPFPVDQPRPDHNGGSVEVFGTDLYIALGDGGPGDGRLAQDDSTILGKLLRFDLTQDPPPAEVIGKGLRNPYRFSIDSETGDIYIGDVGTNLAEEITIVPKADLVGAPLNQTAPLNFGWPIEEGFTCIGPTEPTDPPCGDPSLYPPVFDYDHSNFRVAVVGGVVYRGSDRSLRGTYYFGDWLARDFWSLEWTASQGLAEDPVSENSLFAPINQLVAYGSGNDGEVYVVESNNAIYKLVPEPAALFSGLVAVASVWGIVIVRRRFAA